MARSPAKSSAVPGDAKASPAAGAEGRVPASAVDGGTHQSIARLDLLLSALAGSKGEGLRLMEVCRVTGLGKATAHRLLSGLVLYGLAELDQATGRYFVGFKVLSWAAGAGNRLGLAQLVRPALERLVARFEDAVYLTMKRGDESVCVERLEGTYPIKTLAFDVGDHRPLGIGAGSMAILAALPDAEVERIVRTSAEARARYDIPDALVWETVKAARRDGYAFVDGKVVPGICTLGIAFAGKDGGPAAAISVSAIKDRMGQERRREMAQAIAAELSDLAARYAPLMSFPAPGSAAGR